MKIKTYVALGLGLMLAVFSSVGIASATTINDPWAPHSSNSTELNLYQIYNHLYGTHYTSSGQLPQVDPSGIFNSPNTTDFVATAHFAANSETFGIYQPTGAPSTFVPIFSNVSGPSGYINISDTVPGVSGNFGFYLYSAGNNTNTWYSQSSLNSDNTGHMVALSTPDPNVLLFAWEDLPRPLADMDYQDLVVSWTRIVPEPTSMSLLGIGLAGTIIMGYKSKKSKQS